jgi:hypothetical protein
MFVMAIHVDMSFPCFLAIFAAGICDGSLPLDPNYEPPTPMFRNDIERFRRFQDETCVLGVPPSFRYKNFTTEIPGGLPMAIQFSPEEVNHGAAGKVCKAKIDMRYHDSPDLTADPYDPQLSQTLAIKVISNSNSTFAFRERNFLQALSDHNMSHPHILNSYTGFEYRETTYLLSEKAETNLLRFMTGYPTAAAASVDGTWLRDQYTGLIGALATIHGPTNGHTAYHHDIKPSNILVFKHNNALKLSDWGCATMKPNDLQQAILMVRMRGRCLGSGSGMRNGIQRTVGS